MSPEWAKDKANNNSSKPLGASKFLPDTDLTCNSSCQHGSNIPNRAAIKPFEMRKQQLEAEGKGTKASEGKCGNVKRGVAYMPKTCRF